MPCVQSHCGQLKPSSSVPNNERSSNVLTPAQTHRSSCFPAPPRINRSIYSGGQDITSVEPPVSTALLFFRGRPGKPSTSVHSAYRWQLPLDVFLCPLSSFVSAEQCKCIEWGQTCTSIDTLSVHWVSKTALCTHQQQAPSLPKERSHTVAVNMQRVMIS